MREYWHLFMNDAETFVLTMFVASAILVVSAVLIVVERKDQREKKRRGYE